MCVPSEACILDSATCPTVDLARAETLGSLVGYCFIGQFVYVSLFIASKMGLEFIYAALKVGCYCSFGRIFWKNIDEPGGAFIQCKMKFLKINL
jgi:hypothetical protein